MNLTKVKDVIYKFIPIPSLCKKFIDTPEFQRLRHLKQLGLAHYVYPSAVHTRFEHSLGVMYLAGKVSDVLGFDRRTKELEQLGGLLHDVGHVSFSHLMDYILEEKKFKKEIAQHEFRSISLLKKINSRLKELSPIEEQIVSNIILGKVPKNIDILPVKYQIPAIYEIVSNSNFGVDVDRLDYLQRDLYHTHMPCFQADYIIDNLKIDNGSLAISEKAKPEVEMMYEARKRLLSLICRHKTVIKIEELYRLAISRLNISEEYFAENWEKIDDVWMEYKFREHCPEILKMISSRHFENIKVEDGTKFKHLKYIKKEDIEDQISKVPWV